MSSHENSSIMIASCSLDARDIISHLHSSKISEDCKDVPALDTLGVTGISLSASAGERNLVDNVIVLLRKTIPRMCKGIKTDQKMK